MERTLSATESKVILELEWQNKKIVTIGEIAEILGASKNYAYKLASQLVKKRWLFPISRGNFQLIPAAAGREEPVPEMNAAVFLSTVSELYYVSYAFANNFYGFTSQMPSTIAIVVPAREQYGWRRMRQFHNVRFRFVYVKKQKFFGYTSADLLGVQIKIAEKEKALVDSLDKIGYAGGIEEVSEVFKNALGESNIEKLIDYAFKMGSKALIQRLGFLLDLNEVSLPENLEKQMIEKIKSSRLYLAPPKVWGKKGEFNSRWRLVVNIPLERLAKREEER
jgi:predicted transcriptional regulator of viral defense system